MKVALYLARFQFRGTAIAIYDYACGIMNHHTDDPLIVHWPRPDERDSLGDSRGVSIWEQRGTGAREVFEKRFGKQRVRDYHNWAELNQLMKDEAVDVLYILTGGIKPSGGADGQAADNFDLDEMLSRLEWPSLLNDARVVYHFVYLPPMAGPGSAAISPAVASRVSLYPQGDPNNVLIVPHMLRDWPADMEPSEVQRLRMREYLGIPANATVFGRLGGVDTFNIPLVVRAIERALKVRPDAYFVFATAPIDIMQHPALNSDPRVLFIAPCLDETKRCAVIDCCDYMIHASQKGESFGLNVLEFLSRGRPVITFEPRLSEIDTVGSLWVEFHKAAKPETFWADQHLRHLRVLQNHPSAQMNALFKPYWDDQSLDSLLQGLKPLDPTTVQPARFHEYSEQQVMQCFNKVFLRPDLRSGKEEKVL